MLDLITLLCLCTLVSAFSVVILRKEKMVVSLMLTGLFLGLIIAVDNLLVGIMQAVLFAGISVVVYFYEKWEYE